MTLLDITKFLLEPKDGEGTYINATPLIQRAVDLYGDLFDRNHLKATSSYKEFYNANGIFNAVIDDYIGKDVWLKKEIFYSMATGINVNGLPGELVLAVQKAMNITDTPNNMISVLDKYVLSKYIDKNSGHLLKTLIDELYGYKVNLVTNFRTAVRNRGVVEVYISNIDAVLICNPDIMKLLPHEDDFKELIYTPDKGIVLEHTGDVLRTMISNFGITKDDLDLRGVV